MAAAYELARAGPSRPALLRATPQGRNAVTSNRISVLELRSVRGTGGGPEKTILLGRAVRDRDRFDVTVCYVRDLRDDMFGIDGRAERLDIDYVEVEGTPFLGSGESGAR